MTDTEILDWLEIKENDGCVQRIGTSWYARTQYGMPWRKCQTLREAVTQCEQYRAEKETE